MKKTDEFLIDAKLGEKKYEVANKDSEKEEKIVLTIEEGGTPVTLLKAGMHGSIARRGKKGFFASLNETISSLGKVKARDKATFFRLLSIMMNAGVPLIRALDIISEQTSNLQLKNAIYEIARSIEKGGKLSTSLQNFKNIFDESDIGMVKAGEAGGQINMTLRDLATQVEKLAILQRKVKAALLYPAFVLLVLFAVVTAMMLFVVPQIAEVFKDLDQELPKLTQFLIFSSEFALKYWPFILLILIAIPMTVIGIRKTREGKYFFDIVLLHIPLVGKLIRKSIIARFARNLGNLLVSGVPIIDALKINAKSLGNGIYEEQVELAAEDISRGIPLGENFRDSKYFPNMVVQMIIVGEQTAQLDEICQKMADFYEEEVDIAVNGLAKMLEPIIIVAVGLIVGVIIGAVMVPIIQLADLTS